MRLRSACPEPVVTSRMRKGKPQALTFATQIAILLCLLQSPFQPAGSGTFEMTRALLLVLALFSTTTVLAQDAKGDPAEGRLKAYTCTGCHGITGWKNAYPSYHVPRIGGQNYDYLVAALTEYKNGGRKHPTMRAQGESMSDADIADIAAFLSNLKSAE